MYVTKDINDAIYPGIWPDNKFSQIIDKISFGDDCDDVIAITGNDAMLSAKDHGYEINDKLIPECLYIFKWPESHKKLCAGRVSMHPKMAAAMDRWSRKYGTQHILAEVI